MGSELKTLSDKFMAAQNGYFNSCRFRPGKVIFVQYIILSTNINAVGDGNGWCLELNTALKTAVNPPDKGDNLFSHMHRAEGAAYMDNTRIIMPCLNKKIDVGKNGFIYVGLHNYFATTDLRCELEIKYTEKSLKIDSIIN